MDYKHEISQLINIDGVDRQDVESLIAVPKESGNGDYSLPCFRFARVLRKAPDKIAEDLASDIVAKLKRINRIHERISAVRESVKANLLCPFFCPKTKRTIFVRSFPHSESLLKNFLTTSVNPSRKNAPTLSFILLRLRNLSIRSRRKTDISIFTLTKARTTK